MSSARARPSGSRQSTSSSPTASRKTRSSPQASRARAGTTGLSRAGDRAPSTPAGCRARPSAALRRGRGANCARAFPFRSRIGFINAPFRSITFRTSKSKWTKTGAPSQARLAANCPLYMNYDSTRGPTDPVVGAIRQLVFKNGNLNTKNGIGYRYTTADGAFALVSVHSGFKKRTEDGIKDIGMWAYTPRPCVQPLSSGGGSNVAWIYQREIRICDGVKPTEAAKRMNRSRPADRIKRVRPCRLPNRATRPGQPSPDHPENGWNIGSLRTPR